MIFYSSYRDPQVNQHANHRQVPGDTVDQLQFDAGVEADLSVGLDHPPGSYSIGAAIVH